MDNTFVFDIPRDGKDEDEDGGLVTTLQLLSTRVFEISMPPFASAQ